jgi:hypothetical protein
MALVRCENHGWPEGRTRTYIRSVEPIGFPETAAICGRHGCENPGLIWLEPQEAAGYEAGQRVFHSESSTMRVRAK